MASVRSQTVILYMRCRGVGHNSVASSPAIGILADMTASKSSYWGYSLARLMLGARLTDDDLCRKNLVQAIGESFDIMPIKILANQRWLAYYGPDVLHHGAGKDSACLFVSIIDLKLVLLIWMLVADYGPLLSALHNRDMLSLVVPLQESHKRSLETGPMGETFLHIAACWPHGLRAVFELAPALGLSALDLVDNYGRTPLYYALNNGQVESAGILFAAGARLCSEDMKALFNTLPQDRNVVYRSVSQHLASKRKRLAAFPSKMLTASPISDLSLRNDALLQDEKYAVRVSEKTEIALQCILGEDWPGTMYHFPDLRAEMAEELFQAGFHLVDVDVNGLTPLMVLNLESDAREFIRIVSWLLGHGGDLWRPIPCPPQFRASEDEVKQYRPIHRLAAMMGTNPPILVVYRANLCLNDYQDCATLALLRRISSEECRDPCICFCSQDGCVPAGISTRYSLEARRWFLPGSYEIWERLG